MSIGISYTTRNRPEALEYVLTKMRQFLPPEAKVVIVDDNSDDIFRNKNADLSHGFEYVFNEKRLGVPHSKNVGFQRLKDCDYQFWFDDDCYPMCEGWHLPFIDAMEGDQKHLLYMHKWMKFECVARIGNLERFSGCTGCLLTFHKDTYVDVEGFHEGFTLYGMWHFALTTKMYDKGHSALWVATVADAGSYIHAFDINGCPADYKAKRRGSSFTKKDRTDNWKNRTEAHEAFKRFVGEGYASCVQRFRLDTQKIKEGSI